MSPEQFDLYANWYAIPIREMVALKDFKEDPEWIGKKLNPRVSVPEVRSIMNRLLEVGLLKRNKAGKLIQSQAHIKTPQHLTSLSLSKFHKQMIQLGADSIDRVERGNREVSSMTFNISKKSDKSIKELIMKTKQQVTEILNQHQK